MVRQWQQLFYEKRYSYTCINFAPDFVKLAEAYGALGIRIEKKGDVDEAIHRALAEKERPVILDFKVDREENVYPMVPAGKTIKDTITRELV